MKLALFGLLCLPAALAVTPPRAVREDCTFSVGADDTALTSYKFTVIGDTPVKIIGKGNCELTVVAVGGGGYGFWGGGGGSGMVVSSTIAVPASELVVRVGGPGELSSLETSEGQTIITAQPGEDRHPGSGGDGYCGGGGGGNFGTGFSGGDGGQDGGDGHIGVDGYHLGGAGSGLDISSISMEIFSLSPGAAGQGGGGSLLSSGWGGGGGDGPQETEYDGQGYGGGGGGAYYNTHLGHPGPGLVLLEIKPKQ